jgi:hypothetical protein
MEVLKHDHNMATTLIYLAGVTCKYNMQSCSECAQSKLRPTSMLTFMIHLTFQAYSTRLQMATLWIWKPTPYGFDLSQYPSPTEHIAHLISTV